MRLDPNPRTVELLRAERFEDPLFVIGADQFCDFLTWNEPAEVLALTRIAVATRPGFPRERLDGVLWGSTARTRPVLRDRAESAASRDIRARIAVGEPLDGLVPEAVAG